MASASFSSAPPEGLLPQGRYLHARMEGVGLVILRQHLLHRLAGLPVQGGRQIASGQNLQQIAAVHQILQRPHHLLLRHTLALGQGLGRGQGVAILLHQLLQLGAGGTALPDGQGADHLRLMPLMPGRQSSRMTPPPMVSMGE